MRVKKQSALEQIANATDPIKTAVDFSATVAGKGFCIVDETDGKTYRITTQNGILVTTVVI